MKVNKKTTKADIHGALMILCLRDIMMNDETLSMRRILLHISNEYDIVVTKEMINEKIKDSKELIKDVTRLANKKKK